MNFSTAFGKFPRAFFFFFRSKRSLVSVGYWKKKLQILLVKTVVFVKGVLEERKYEKLQIFLARQPISLQWVVGEKSFRKSGPLHRFLSSGY